MGLAASQGRLLCLTARDADLIYEGQQIAQQRLALADQQQKITEDYTEAMNNTMFQATAPDGTQQRLTYDILIDRNAFTGLGMRLVDENGYVIVPGSGANISFSDEEGNESEHYDLSNIDIFIDKYLTPEDDKQREQYLNLPLSQLYKIYSDKFEEGETIPASYNDKYAYLKSSNERYGIDENVTDPEYLQEMIKNGLWHLEKINEKSDWEDFEWQSSTQLTEIYDTSDDAAAEAEYQAQMLATQKRDKLLEMRLEEVQTEEAAVSKDIESIKNVIDKNIDTSFTTFKA